MKQKRKTEDAQVRIKLTQNNFAYINQLQDKNGSTLTAEINQLVREAIKSSRNNNNEERETNSITD